MSPVAKAALRLEMAEGLVQAIAHGSSDASKMEEAIFVRDSYRNLLHEAVREATGYDPKSLARVLAL